MKRYHYHAMLAGMLLLLSACTANEESGLPGEATDTTRRPLTITAGMDNVIMTRSVADTLKSGTLSVFRKGTGYLPMDNLPYVWNAATESWTPTIKDYTIYVDQHNAEVYAYYPHTTGTTVHNLEMQRYSRDKAEEVLYAPVQLVNNLTALVNFRMKSPYSRVTFRFLNANLPYCVIKSATISFSTNILTKGTVDVSVGNPVVSAGAEATVSYSFPLTAADSIYTLGIGTGQWDETLDLLMIPGQKLPAMTLSVNMKMTGLFENATTSVSIPATAVSELLQQGKQYIIPLLVQGSEITLYSLSVPGIEGEEENDPFNENKVTAYTLSPVALEAGLNAGTGNLYRYQSDLIATSKNPNYALDGNVNYWYGFSGRNGKMWVEKDKTAESTFSSGGTDYCTRIGPNWRMPTNAELQRFSQLSKQAGSCNDTNTGAQSGWWVGTYNSSLGYYQKTAVFFTYGTYVSAGGGKLTVNSSGITYSASGGSSGWVRCVSDTQF